MLYLFDGTEKGFLTAFLLAFTDENAIVSSRQEQMLLGQTLISVQTDEQKAEKVKRRLAQFDREALSELSLLLRSGEEDCEQVAFAYLRYLANCKRPVRNDLANEAVFAADRYLRKIRFEIHRFHGFIRFMETQSGALYAPFSPDNDICDLLLPHFRARLPKYPFVLHDVKRKKAVRRRKRFSRAPCAGGRFDFGKRSGLAITLERVLRRREYSVARTVEANARIYARTVLEVYARTPTAYKLTEYTPFFVKNKGKRF